MISPFITTSITILATSSSLKMQPFLSYKPILKSLLSYKPILKSHCSVLIIKNPSRVTKHNVSILTLIKQTNFIFLTFTFNYFNLYFLQIMSQNLIYFHFFFIPYEILQNFNMPHL